MKIVCPTCEATYEVPESVLASQRALRCARCGNEWVPGANWQPDSPGDGTHADPAHDVFHEPIPEPFPDADIGMEPGSVEPVIEAGTPEPPTPEPPTPEPRVAAALPPDTAPLPPAAARLRQTAATAFGDPAAETPAEAVPLTRPPVGAWIASIAFLLALAVGGLVFKAQVMKAWPASERLYAAIGLVPAQ